MKTEDYKVRVYKVLKYIDEHIDESLTIAKLCHIADFSQYHFHRLFSVVVGMPLIKYIQYIKLKRAAYQLIMQKHKKIIEIAFAAGFESHEAFSRAFKKSCGLSPSQFRKAPYWPAWKIQPYKTSAGREMSVAIKAIPSIRTSAVSHVGSPMLLHETAAKLIEWGKRNNRPLKSGECYGIAYNDPDVTPDDKFRFDFCMKIESSIKSADGFISEHLIPGGRYAIARHLGSHDMLGDTVRILYRDWLPESSESLCDAPCFFQYHNFAHDVQESALITDVYLPLK